MKLKEIQAKTILTKSSISEIDLYFNPYIGCSFACTYCLVKYMKSFSDHTQDKWGDFIDCKNNTIELLKKEIHKAKGKNVMVGSLTDVYQPIEKKYEIIRNSLEIFKNNNISTYILTKSDLVLRDIDILTNMPTAKIGMTIAISDEKIRKVLEPHASNTVNRLKALSLLGKGKCKTFAFIGPIIPELSNLDEIFLCLREAQVDFVMGKTIDLSYPFAHEFLFALKSIVGMKKTHTIDKLSKDIEFIKNTEEKFNNLCKIHNIENHGFINPYAKL